MSAHAYGHVLIGVGASVKTFRALFPSEYRSVSAARRAVARFAAECGFANDSVSDIALAVGEACNNAAEHGHVVHGFFTVECQFTAGTISIVVQDVGRGFDPSGKGEPMEPEQRGVRGLGIFIMRALMDSVTFSQTNQGTKVVLSKRSTRRDLLKSANRRQGVETTAENLRSKFSAVRPATSA